jgi:hypothetical protein
MDFLRGRIVVTFAHLVAGFGIFIAIFIGLLAIPLNRKRTEIEKHLKEQHTETFLIMYSPLNEKYDSELSDIFFDNLIATGFVKLNDKKMTALVSEYKTLRASCFILAIILFLTLVLLR